MKIEGRRGGKLWIYRYENVMNAITFSLNPNQRSLLHHLIRNFLYSVMWPNEPASKIYASTNEMRTTLLGYVELMKDMDTW